MSSVNNPASSADGVVYKDDKEYPELLRQIGKDAPKQLYYKGNWDNKRSSYSKISERFTLKGSDASQKFQNTRFQKPSIFENCLAVIGSRNLTNYGKQAIERLVGEIAVRGITIVSGFMYGGDAIAHKAAVDAGGRTIAVMPCGIDKIHPEYQEDLYNEILENNGLIISEYEGDMLPALWTYPQRNRIVAGLSKALLIVEAGEKSGCLITANCAKKFNRKIFVVPGPITSSVSKGSNMLIKQGAEMVLSAKDVLEYFQKRSSHLDFFERFSPEGTPRVSKKSKSLASKKPDASQKIQNHRSNRLRSFEKKILELLEREPLGIDELSRNLGISSSELGTKLSMMEIKDLIKLRGNKYGIN